MACDLSYHGGGGDGKCYHRRGRLIALVQIFLAALHPNCWRDEEVDCLVIGSAEALAQKCIFPNSTADRIDLSCRQKKRSGCGGNKCRIWYRLLKIHYSYVVKY